jgi:PQQ-like domain
MVFAVGSTFLVAYDAATGAELWQNSAGHGQSVAVSPNGQVVFVIRSVRASGSADFATSAFDAASGKQLWTRLYNGRADGTDLAVALAVSPGGGTVFVTGTSKGSTTAEDYATVAYAAASGRQLWVSRYNGSGRSRDIPESIAVSPTGGVVFVTGYSFGSKTGSEFATVAYRAANGKPLWTRRYGQPDGRNAADSVAVSPNGKRIFVTGSVIRRGSGSAIGTVAYSAGTGAQQWVRRYQGPSDRDDYPRVVLVSPAGGIVLIAGQSTGHGARYLCVAYSAVTGRTKWVRRFVVGDYVKEYLAGAAISQDGKSFYLTGWAYVIPGGEEPSQDLTVAANLATGAQRWSQAVTTGLPDEAGLSVAVNPHGGAVYVGVEDFTATSPHGFTAVAFRA